MTDLSELLKRVEEATEADVLIDNDIYWALGDWENLGGHWMRHKVTGERRHGNYPITPAYTASIDAALALVEKVLPGAEYEISTLYGIASAKLPLNDGTGGDELGEATRTDGNVPLAILAALLRAKIADSTP